MVLPSQHHPAVRLSDVIKRVYKMHHVSNTQNVQNLHVGAETGRLNGSCCEDTGQNQNLILQSYSSIPAGLDSALSLASLGLEDILAETCPGPVGSDPGLQTWTSLCLTDALIWSFSQYWTELFFVSGCCWITLWLEDVTVGELLWFGSGLDVQPIWTQPCSERLSELQHADLSKSSFMFLTVDTHNHPITIPQEARTVWS